MNKKEIEPFSLVYRNDNYLAITSDSDYYYNGVFIYNDKGQMANLTGTVGLCETTSLGYKKLIKGDISLDNMIWFPDTNAFNKLLSAVETIDGQSINVLPKSKYYFIYDYNSILIGPQNRKFRKLNRTYNYKKDSIYNVFINKDFVMQDSALYNWHTK